VPGYRRRRARWPMLQLRDSIRDFARAPAYALNRKFPSLPVPPRTRSEGLRRTSSGPSSRRPFEYEFTASSRRPACTTSTGSSTTYGARCSCGRGIGLGRKNYDGDVQLRRGAQGIRLVGLMTRRADDEDGAPSRPKPPTGTPSPSLPPAPEGQSPPDHRSPRSSMDPGPGARGDARGTPLAHRVRLGRWRPSACGHRGRQMPRT